MLSGMIKIKQMSNLNIYNQIPEIAPHLKQYQSTQTQKYPPETYPNQPITPPPQTPSATKPQQPPQTTLPPTTTTPLQTTLQTPQPTAKVYDYVIVGAGPTGLTLAQILSRRKDLKTIIVDLSPAVGGVHQVRRDGTVPGVFTEHSVRIYSSSYQNLKTIMSEWSPKQTFNDVFTPYKFSIDQIGNKNWKSLKAGEKFALVRAFIRFFTNTQYGHDISMSEFCTANNFTIEGKDYIDRLCRLVDGADSTRFPLYAFLSIANQEWLNQLHQPRKPTDLGFISYWSKFLTDRGVEFRLSSEVTGIDPDTQTVTIKDGSRIAYKRLVLATNPYIIHKLDKTLFPEITPEYASDTNYNTYVSFTYQWPYKVEFPKLQGFLANTWGVVYVVMTDYFKEEAGTIMSVSITYLDKKSEVLDKAANEIQDPVVVMMEAWRQLSPSFPNVPAPPIMSMYPGVRYAGEPPYGGWVSQGSSFINTSQNHNKFIPFASSKYTNIFNCGCQNGYQSYAFTAIEAAVTNAMALVRELEPVWIKHDTIKSTMTLVQILRILFLGLTGVMFGLMLKWPKIFAVFFTLLFALTLSWMAASPGIAIILLAVFCTQIYIMRQFWLYIGIGIAVVIAVIMNAGLQEQRVPTGRSIFGNLVGGEVPEARALRILTKSKDYRGLSSAGGIPSRAAGAGGGGGGNKGSGSGGGGGGNKGSSGCTSELAALGKAIAAQKT